MKLNLDFILSSTGGVALSKKQTEFSGCGTDTRKDLSNQVFIALKGDVHDAHKYLDKAVQAKAAALLIHDDLNLTEEILSQVTVIKVTDTLKAYQDLARAYRKTLKAKVVAMTGSNGKTTTKEFTQQILESYMNVYASIGSYNNHWGVPYTLLECPQEAQVLVAEMGMNHSGEITELVKIAEPDVVVCTMVGRAHIEHFGSVDGIAKAKYEIYEASAPQVLRIFSLDQKETRDMFEREKNRLGAQLKSLTFSSGSPNADVYMTVQKTTQQGLEVEGHIQKEKFKANIALFGAHNLTNIMAAACLSLAAGLTPQQVIDGFQHLKTAWGRNQFLKTQIGATLIFDGYNANPDSFEALLTNAQLVTTKGVRTAIFGQMRELGEHSEEMHFTLGQKTSEAGFDQVIFIGDDFESFQMGFFASHYMKASESFIFEKQFSENLAKKIASQTKKDDVVFLKASRGTEIERFIPYFQPLDYKAKV